MAIRTTYKDPEGEDPFRDFTLAELIAFMHKSLGASGLQAFFSEFDSDYGQQLKREYKIDLWRETLIDAADELSLLNLGKCAAIVMEEAERRPSGFDRPNEWAATEDKHWRASMERERSQWGNRRRYFLATGKRWNGSVMPPSVIAELPATN
jgi:hypothetical protein